LRNLTCFHSIESYKLRSATERGYVGMSLMFSHMMSTMFVMFSLTDVPLHVETWAPRCAGRTSILRNWSSTWSPSTWLFHL